MKERMLAGLVVVLPVCIILGTIVFFTVRKIPPAPHNEVAAIERIIGEAAERRKHLFCWDQFSRFDGTDYYGTSEEMCMSQNDAILLIMNHLNVKPYKTHGRQIPESYELKPIEK